MYDIVTLKLFDEHGKCRYIEPIRAIRTTDDTGVTSWRLASKKMHTIVFTAHKPTTIRYGTAQSEKLDVSLKQCGFHSAVRCRLPDVNDVKLDKCSTLTLQLGGWLGTDPLLTLS